MSKNMKINCLKCETEFEKVSEFDSEVCQTCQNKSETKPYEGLSQTFFYLGFIFMFLFVPCLVLPLLGESRNGYYTMPEENQYC